MSGKNTSGISPMYDKVLVEPKEVETRTAGGLYMPDDVVEKEGFSRREGVVMAIGPAAFNLEGWPEDATRPQVGDRIMFSRYNADEIKGKDGKTYWIMRDQSVMAVID